MVAGSKNSVTSDGKFYRFPPDKENTVDGNQAKVCYAASYEIS